MLCQFFQFQSLILILIIRKMSFFRSDDMECFRLIIPRESAWETLNLLGKHNLIHILSRKDNLSKRIFNPQIKACEQSLEKIKQIERFMVENKIGYRRQFMVDQQFKDLQQLWQVHEKNGGIDSSKLNEVEDQVEHIWKYQQQLLSRKANLKQKLLVGRQNQAIILAGKKQYGQSFFEIKSTFFDNPDHASIFGLRDLEVKAVVLQNAKDLAMIKRTVTRMSKGISFINDVPYKDIFDKTYPGEQQKSVLFLIFPAKKGSILDKKIMKIIENYCPHWQNYTLPQTDSNFSQKFQNLKRIQQQTQKMYEMTQQQDLQFLRSLLGKVEGKNITQLQYYKFYLLKQKQIYSQLNQMNTHLNFIEAEAFIRKQDVQQVQQILYKVSTEAKTPIATLSQQNSTTKLPTHFRINDFKLAAQQITNTYGVPRYQQANPSYFTLITFPFLFGVMFGDIAHGFIAFLFGIYLTFQSQSNSHFAIRMLFPYRYLIMLMGFFATYCGFIYNDFLSLSLNLFGSCYNLDKAQQGGRIHRLNNDCVYPFGVDPIWSISTNYLNYINSLKMKISVIIAVIHMTVGVFVKASNAKFFKNTLEFIFEFIPQLIFLVAFFGYMDFLIIFKWLKPWQVYDSHAPSIITTMINMPLKVGKTDKCCGGEPMWGQVGNTSQDQIQFILLILAVICIPLMLIPKPLILICRNRRHASQHVQNPANESQLPMGNNSPSELMKGQTISKQNRKVAHKQEEHSDSGQIVVHQLIETIQYVLGCISNTASYLRLWALSLAHSQLSQVFFQKSIEQGISKGKAGIPILVLAFPILAAATFGVLLCMDSMQCFLHTLRLHWVEFQNKFYKGDGFLFTPISFKSRIMQNVSKS